MKSLDHDTRVVILYDRFVLRRQFKDIALHHPELNASSCQTYCNRVKQRAGSEIWQDLLDNAYDKLGRGRKCNVIPGSELALRIRHAIAFRYPYMSQHKAANLGYQKHRKHDQNQQRRHLGELKPTQVHNICHNNAHNQLDTIKQKPITRKKALRKPALEKLNLPKREQYVNQLRLMTAAKDELIVCDETPIQFGGSGIKQHASAYAGDVVFQDQKDSRFQRMQWDAASTALTVRRRWLAWKPENAELTASLVKRLEEAQDILDTEVRRQREAATHPDTTEYQMLQDTNRENTKHNSELPTKARKGRLQKMTIERLFKFEKVSRDAGKGGIDAVFYAFEVYQKQLFPYYEEVRAQHPEKNIWIAEDNVGLHHKARRILAPMIKAKGIKFLDTPANSPDLNPIETLHSDQKSILREFVEGVTGADKVIQDSAEIEMEHTWCDDEVFAQKVAKRLNWDNIHTLYERCANADSPYSNRYKDSI
jgi:hypothetical protein